MYASQYLSQISELLRRLPRVILLMLKTNDCLRAVNIALVRKLFGLYPGQGCLVLLLLILCYPFLASYSFLFVVTFIFIVYNVFTMLKLVEANLLKSWPKVKKLKHHGYVKAFCAVTGKCKGTHQILIISLGWGK